MKRPSIDQLLQDEFRFLIDDAGFEIVELDGTNYATLEHEDLCIALRWDWKDGCFSVVMWRKNRLDRFYSLVDYLEYFDKRRVDDVRDIPSPHEQAARLRVCLPRIVRMLHAENDCPDWRGFDKFYQSGRSRARPMPSDFEIPVELAPFYEVCFILGFGICEDCGREQEFTSTHPQYSDEYWLDEARAMYDAGWIIPHQQVAYCPECAARRQSANTPHDK